MHFTKKIIHLCCYEKLILLLLIRGSYEASMTILENKINPRNSHNNQ
jgi:hypothetical protein